MYLPKQMGGGYGKGKLYIIITFLVFFFFCFSFLTKKNFVFSFGQVVVENIKNVSYVSGYCDYFPVCMAVNLKKNMKEGRKE